MGETIFDFEIVESSSPSQEQIDVWIEEIRSFFLECGNPFSMMASTVLEAGFSRKTMLALEEAGVIEELSNDGQRFKLKSEFMRYYSVEEAAEKLEERIEEALIVNGEPFYNVFQIRNFHTNKYPIKNEDKDHYYRLQETIIKRYAVNVGLDHFINEPKSRGHKVNMLKSEFEVTHVIPMIAADVIPMTEYDDVADYFKSKLFFCGRMDYVPYPEYKILHPMYLDIASLAEATDIKTVKLILSYCSGGYTRTELNERLKNKGARYPEGWSHDRYLTELSADDFARTCEDQERLKQMHGGNWIDV